MGNNDNTNADDAKSVLGGSSDPHYEEQKILGVCWNFINDQLVFDLPDIATNCCDFRTHEQKQSWPLNQFL